MKPCKEFPQPESSLQVPSGMVTSRLAIQTTAFILEGQLGLVGFNGRRDRINLAQEGDTEEDARRKGGVGKK